MSCPVHGANCPYYVPHRGPASPTFAIVGEGPGRDELRVKQAFVGSAGKLLNDLLSKAGLNRDDALVINSVPCFGHDNLPYTPTEREVVSWRPYLFGCLLEARPRLIIATGATALYALTGRKDIGAQRGKEREVQIGEGYSPLVLPTYHSAAVLRDPAKRTSVIADLSKASAVLSGKDEPEWAPYLLVDNDFILFEATTLLPEQPTLAFDVESTGRPFRGGSVVLVGVGAPGSPAYIFPIAHPEADKEFTPKLVDGLERIFSEHQGVRVAHNGKFDEHMLRQLLPGVEQPFMTWDSMLAAHLLDESRADRRGMSLKTLALEVLGLRSYEKVGISATKQLKKGPKTVVLPLDLMLASGRIMEVPLSQLCVYNSKDVAATGMLYEVFSRELDADPQLKRVFTNIVMPASRVMGRLEEAGLLIDRKWLDQGENGDGVGSLEDLLTRTKAVVREKLDGLQLGVNWDSPLRVSKLLYDDLKLPVVRKSKRTGAPSVDEESLLLLQGMHPVCDTLVSYRKASKALSTYVEGIREHISSDGRIHPTFIIAGPATGRTASRDPNTQNLPRTREGEPPVRNIVVAPPGHMLVEIDLSLAEVRWSAEVYNEPTIKRLLTEGNRDIHLYTASLAFGKPEDQISKEERTYGKIANFLLLYGGGAGRLAQSLRKSGVSVEQARQALANMGQSPNTKEPVEALAAALYMAFHRAYPKLREAHDKIRRQAGIDKQVRSAFGRIRRLPGVDSSSREVREEALRQAVNTVVQGPASDTCLLGLITIVEHIAPLYQARVIDAVHDAVVAEVPEGEVQGFVEAAKHAMENPPLGAFGINLSTPIIADAKVGKAWGSMHDIKPEAKESGPFPVSTIVTVEREPTPPPSCYAWATLYLQRGWSIIPLTAPGMGFQGRDTGKIPYGDWKQYQSRRMTLEEAGAIFNGANKGSRFNLGVVTGSISRIVVVDIDRKTGGLAWLSEHPELRDLAGVVETGGGGLHLYFSWDGPPIANRVGLAAGVDVRGEGGYVVVPPSLHDSGNSYIWADEGSIWGLQPLPGWLAEELQRPAVEEKPEPVEGGGRAIPPDKIEAMVEFLSPFYVEGTRHEFQRALQGFLAKRDFNVEDVALVSRGLMSATGDMVEVEDRIRLLHDTYAKVRAGGVVAGLGALEDFIGPGGRDHLLSLFGTVRGSSLLRVLPLDEFLLREPPKQVWVIDHLLPVGGMFMLSGNPGAGKTTLAMQLTLSLAAGTPVWQTFSVPRPMSVLYLQADNPPHMVHNLLRRMSTKIPAEAHSRVYVANIVAPVWATTPEGYDSLLQAVNLWEPDVLILDTIRDFHTLDENNPTEVANVMGALKRLRGDREMAIGFLHHHSKTQGLGERAMIERHMGSMRFVTPTDLSMALTFKPENMNYVSLHFTKVRWGPTPTAMLFERVDDWYEMRGPDA